VFDSGRKFLHKPGNESVILLYYSSIFDFMKYGLLGDIESPKESSVKDEI
jgi:hypothetical protein